ncbi:MAG: hypothetical protein R2941_21430 [Desulfobacterales bacterium]
MKDMKTDKGICIFCAAMVLILLLIAGCSSLRSTDSGVGSSGPVPGGPGSLYYGFSDVLIPGELTENKKGSYVVQSNGFAAGVLAFKGRVDRGSLISFFRENMAKDGWRPIASFASNRTILLFQKANRWCVINITDGDFFVSVEVGVVPTNTDISEGIVSEGIIR